MPLLILGGAGVLLLTITSFIKNRAEVQKEKARLECIKIGACTDTGFWLKTAAIVVLGWFVWDKLGVGKKVMGKIGKPATRRRTTRRRRR